MAFPNLKGSGKPSPFQRPGVDLDRPTRQWREIPAHKLTLEDIVPDIGKITDMQINRRKESEDYIWIMGAGGNVAYYGWTETVFAFTNAK
jgi:hypothetical protein